MADPAQREGDRDAVAAGVDVAIEAAIDRWFVRYGACAHLEPADASALLRLIRREVRGAGGAAGTSGARPPAAEQADAIVAAAVARVRSVRPMGAETAPRP